ncbi:CHAT domain-containing protein [Collybia nuda]|uniref:CHAT domain-containing protein n=1 Tax=Collybia nuda TaxID=64659 RepID=A0A9P6CKI9_9AGAR|nr:CHAT domain-containing protein [Collybia nuda]
MVLQLKYERHGNLDYLEEIVNCHTLALELCLPDGLGRHIYLNGIGIALWERYRQLGEKEDLERAITYYEQALDLHTPGHPGKSIPLSNLANALQTRYEQLGQMDDLGRAIIYHEQVLDLCSFGGHSDRFVSLTNLANALHMRYEQLGQMEDLQKTISFHEQALKQGSPAHPNTPGFLVNLANDLQSRYEQLGDMEDLKKSISYLEQALNLCPPDNPDMFFPLGSLANALKFRYEQLGERGDLERAITCHKQALDLCVSGHHCRSMSLNGLGNALQAKYEQLGDIEDLENSIACHEQALHLCAPGHPQRSMSLNNLANALQTRYEQLGRMEDLENTLICLEQTMLLRPPGHPFRTSVLNNLGYILYTKYNKLGDVEYLQSAINYHKQAAYADSHIPQQLVGAKQWARIAHQHQLGSSTLAYPLALDLLQQNLVLLPSLTSQQILVEKSSYLSLDAAACAIGNGTPEIAVQLLEQGRSILWSKIQGYRQPINDISEKAPHLAKEFQDISNQLESNITSYGADTTLQHTLSKRWTALLGEIRELDGFSDYLKTTPFEALKEATAEGPVIMVNISYFRSDAIILVSQNPPKVIPLDNVSPKVLEELVGQLSKITATSDSSDTTYHILRQLWKLIVKPVITQLEKFSVPERSHIWWCPTSYLCVLPLHAAGPYEKGSMNLPDLYISSYAPTLASLIRARSSMPKPHASPLLLISQPDDTIPHVYEEAKIINNLQVQVDTCSDHAATKQGVLASLQSHPWVHFACHGHLEAQPFHSWFQLFNGEHLTVLDLAKAHLPNAEFAFLSACHSAAGSIYGTPDESIHLAGALHFSGFRSVVGTLWAMVDDDGPPVANAFYKHMFLKSETMDLRDSGTALNIATRELRKQKVPVNRWINFIHIGA